MTDTYRSDAAGAGVGDHAPPVGTGGGGAHTNLPEPFGPYPEYVYALRQPFLVDLSDPRYRAVEKAVKWVEGKTATELSRETHDYSRSWQMGNEVTNSTSM